MNANNSTVRVAIYARVSSERQSREGTINSQLEALRARVGQDHLQTFADRVNAGLDDMTMVDRREIIRALVKRIEVDAEEVKIVYRVDCGPFARGPEKGRVQDCWWRRDATPSAACAQQGKKLAARGPQRPRAFSSTEPLPYRINRFRALAAFASDKSAVSVAEPSALTFQRSPAKTALAYKPLLRQMSPQLRWHGDHVSIRFAFRTTSAATPHSKRPPST
jgi:hypothetical protein